MDELASEIVQEAAVQADIQTSRTSMGDLRNGLHSGIAIHPARSQQHFAVTDAMRERSARYAEELRRIWLAMEPGWTYGASEGRLDMNRVFAATSDEELESVLSAAKEAGAVSAGYVLLRLPLEIKALFHEWLGEKAPNKAKHVISLALASLAEV